MKNLIFILLVPFLILGCAGQSVRLTEKETDQLMSENPTLIEMLKKRGRTEGKYEHRYTMCENKRNKSADTCNKIQCFGLEDPIKCFKTPMTEDEFQDYQGRLKASTIPSYQVNQYRDSCFKGEKELSKTARGPNKTIQSDCFTYLTSSYEVEINAKYISDYEKAATIFCNMTNSYCRKNGNVFGQSGYNHFASDVQTRGMTLKYGGKTYAYEFGLSQD